MFRSLVANGRQAVTTFKTAFPKHEGVAITTGLTISFTTAYLASKMQEAYNATTTPQQCQGATHAAKAQASKSDSKNCRS